jgi:hypothetical protein
MYVVNFTQPRYGSVKFPDAQPPLSFNSGDTLSAAAAAAAGSLSAVGPAASFREGHDWKVHGQLQYTLDPSVTRPVTDQVTLQFVLPGAHVHSNEATRGISRSRVPSETVTLRLVGNVGVHGVYLPAAAVIAASAAGTPFRLVICDATKRVGRACMTKQ